MSGSVQSAPACSPAFDVVIAVGSQGTLPLYGELFSQLDHLPAPFVLAQHRRPGGDALQTLLQCRTGLDVREPEDGERLQPGTLYLCPADRQLGFDPAGRVVLRRLTDGRRPTGDAVMRSAAAVYGGRVLAIILSGRLQDGAAGARSVKAAGGYVLAQDPRTAVAPSMPSAALATGCVDACLPARSVGAAVNAFVSVPGAARLFAVRSSPWAWPLPAEGLDGFSMRLG